VEKATLDQYVWVQGESVSAVGYSVDNVVPYTGIYLDRFDNQLKAESIHTSMRPLCQQVDW